LSPAHYQHIPLKVIGVASGGDQRLYPSLKVDGTPDWQLGDGDVRQWEIESLGWTHGAPANRRDYPGIRGSVFLTDSRLVAISGNYVQGGKSSAYGFGNQLLLTTAASKISNMKASRDAAGTFLVGQMRLPWITGVVFGGEAVSKNSRGEVRLLGEHVTAFGDPETVMLLFRLRRPIEAPEFVEELSERVKRDRLSWRDTTDDQCVALNQLPSPRALRVSENTLPMISFPVAYRINANTASNGANSMKSFSTS